MSSRLGLQRSTEPMRAAQDQRATLRYFKWEGKFEREKPYSLLIDAPGDFPSENFALEEKGNELIQDIRGREWNFSLDSNGFAVRKWTLLSESLEKSNVEQAYLPLVLENLRQEFGAECEIFFFDWRLRSSDSEAIKRDPEEYIDLADPQLILKPAQSAHVDQSPAAARRRVEHHMKSRSKELLAKRWRIINVWRPLVPVVEDYPLALCDGKTVLPGDLIAVDNVRSTYVGESLFPVYRDYYKWYYISKQTWDEVLLLKMYDSALEIAATCSPHTSFKVSGAPAEARRESIEVRALVFTEN